MSKVAHALLTVSPSWLAPTVQYPEPQKERFAMFAELVLEIPILKPERKPVRPARREPRQTEDQLVPDMGPSGDLVPDSYGGFQM